MRYVRALICVLLAALALAPAAWANETIEGRGYRVRVPAGYVEAPEAAGTGNANARAYLDNVPVAGEPDLKIFMRGSPRDPDGVVILMSVELDGREIHDLESLGLADMEQRAARELGGGFTARRRTVADAREAIEIVASLEAIGVEQLFRVLMVPCGDYVFSATMISLDEPSATAAWEDMVASLRIVPPTPMWQTLLLWGGVGLGVLVLLMIVARVRAGDPRHIQVARHGSGIRAMDSLPWERRAGVPPPGPLPASNGPDLSTTRTPSPATVAGRPAPPGLRSTLPKERWSQD